MKARGQGKRGFTLIEVLMDAVILTIVFGVLAASFISVLKTVNAGKIRTAAAALANEQMESLRNLPYDSLATASGTIFPQGTIPDNQTITRSNTSYNLRTVIIIVDDPFDGCAIPSEGQYLCTDGALSATQDFVPVDYKRITIEVTQPSGTLMLATLSSNAAAKAAETPSNTGMLLVIVNDANGLPVQGATVDVTQVPLGVVIQAFTNAQGYVFIAGIPPDNQNGYHIVATKGGFSSDFTTARTSSNPNQFQPDVDVTVQQITTQTLAIDLLSTAVVTVLDETAQPVAGQSLTLTSTKITQINPETPKHIYSQTTDGSGVATFTDIEWDSYAITVPSGYILTTSPYQKVGVAPNGTQPITLVVSSSASWPRIETVSPTAGVTGAPLSIEIEGDNYSGNATVLLRKTGQADIIPTTINVQANQKSLTATFDLTGAAVGSWDIVLTSNGQTIIQLGGFTIS